MKIVPGTPLPLGVTIQNEKVNFAVAVPEGKKCSLLLYRKGELEPCDKIAMEKSQGEVCTLGVECLDFHLYEYNYLFGDDVVVDPHIKKIAGCETWGSKRDVQKHEVRGCFLEESYDWEEDAPILLPDHEVIAYNLHVRGFTKDTGSGVENKGTFEGIVEKIPYLQELGINQIHCMPVYEFDEAGEKCNYWGYGEGFYFAPKNAYSASGDGVTSLKDMVKACHKAGIEVVLEMPFHQDAPKYMIGECLRYYRMEYHIDGFILNPYVIAMDVINSDPILKKTKILEHQTYFQNDMRRFLKGDEGMVPAAIYWQRHLSQKNGWFNYIASHSGFTAYDMVSYQEKHNEENEEKNRDGSDCNFTWNCGAEGKTDCVEILNLRAHQLRNAFFLVLLSQGMPCILAGDEFANSQNGNNNVYCQDNPTGWVNWQKLEEEKELFTFVKQLIHLRKTYAVLCPEKEMTGLDNTGCGTPDVSYHGENAWQVQADMTSRQLGVFYSGIELGEKACYIAYNMHWLEHEFALPNLPGQKSWYLVASTDRGVLNEPEPVKKQRKIRLQPRTIVVMTER